jgi:hypothetical protein
MSNKLSILIEGLSQGERRKISIQLDQGKSSFSDAYKVFHLITKKGLTKDQDIKTQLPGIKNLGATKHQLFKKIIRSLSSELESFDAKYHDALLTINVLIDREMYPQAHKIVIKLYTQSKKHERLPFMYELYLLELKVLRLQGNNQETLQVIQTKSPEITQIITEAETYLDVHKDYFDVSTFYQKNGAARSESGSKVYKKIAKKLNIVHPLNLLKHSANYYRQLGLITTSFGLNNFDQSLVHTTNLLQIFEQNAHEKNSDLRQYAIVLYNHLAILVFKQDYNSFDKMIHLLKVEDSKNNFAKNFSNERYFNLILFRYLEAKEYKQSIQYLEEFESYCAHKDSKLNKLTEPLLYGLVTSLNMNLKNFKKALHWNNRILQIPNYKSLRKDLTFSTELFEIIIHFELENYDLITYKINSFRSKLSSKTNRHKIEEIFLIHFKKILNKPLNEQQQVLKDLVHEIEKIKDNPFEIDLLKKFDLVNYFNSKIKN